MGRIRMPKMLLPGVILAAAVVLCNGKTTAGDFYAMHVYPALSSVLSLVASPFEFSLQAALIAVFVALFVLIIVKACKEKEGVLTCLLKEATLIAWIFVWVYLGWCLNYSRSPITVRVEAKAAAYDSTAFRSFLTDFTNEMNASWVPDVSLDAETMESEIKTFYSSVPEKYGLCSPKGWQHPKKMPLRRLESAMCILGYIGPFFCEAHLNPDVPASDMPHTFAHEYSHILGVSSEAEANWWAFQCCRHSGNAGMKYSGYLCTLPAIVSNASRLLSEEDYKAWTATIRREVADDFNSDRAYWRAKRSKTLNNIQSWIYDLFLKSNNIQSGILNYSESVSLLISIDYDR